MPRNFGGSILAILLGFALPGAAQPVRTAITPQDVARAVQAAGWHAESSEIKLLSQISSASPAPWLQVMQVSRWQGNSLKVELRCHDPQACLPFYALVVRDNPVTKAADIERQDAAVQQPLEPAVEKFLIRSGDSATLTFADKGLHITMKVICLENGRQGQKIRVSSADRKRFFKGEIVGPGQLTATAL